MCLAQCLLSHGACWGHHAYPPASVLPSSHPYSIEASIYRCWCHLGLSASAGCILCIRQLCCCLLPPMVMASTVHACIVALPSAHAWFRVCHHIYSALVFTSCPGHGVQLLPSRLRAMLPPVLHVGAATPQCRGGSSPASEPCNLPRSHMGLDRTWLRSTTSQ